MFLFVVAYAVTQNHTMTVCRHSSVEPLIYDISSDHFNFIKVKLTYKLLLLDEAIASRAVFVIVSRSDGGVGGNAFGTS